MNIIKRFLKREDKVKIPTNLVLKPRQSDEPTFSMLRTFDVRASALKDLSDSLSMDNEVTSLARKLIEISHKFPLRPEEILDEWESLAQLKTMISTERYYARQCMTYRVISSVIESESSNPMDSVHTIPIPLKGQHPNKNKLENKDCSEFLRKLSHEFQKFNIRLPEYTPFDYFKLKFDIIDTRRMLESSGDESLIVIFDNIILSLVGHRYKHDLLIDDRTK